MTRPAFVKNSIKDLVATIVLALVFCAVYIGVFILKRWIAPSDIIFYDALLWIGLVALALFAVWLIAALAERFTGNFFGTVGRLMPHAIVLFVFIGYAFTITVPALVDRSISLYIIAKTERAGSEGVRKSQLDNWFQDEFVLANNAMGKRLHEQIVTGNMVETDGTFTLTDRGMFVFRIHQWFLAAFNADPSHVMPQGGDRSATTAAAQPPR